MLYVRSQVFKLSQENRKRMYDELVALKAWHRIPDNLISEFGDPRPKSSNAELEDKPSKPAKKATNKPKSRRRKNG